jgi:Voltage-dependent anion channel
MTLRVVNYPRLVLADMTSHARGFAFLTVVAGTNVLGAASAVIHGWWGIAWALWFAGIALWVGLLYITLIAVVLRSPKPGLEAGINGTWFLLTVATESIAVLGALLLGRGDSDALAFTCLALFCLGLVLYVIVMTLVFLRWTFVPLEPTEADPPAWIAAGAVAIIVLAGSNLLLAQDVAPRVARVAPAVEVMVVLAWADRHVLVPADGRHRGLAPRHLPRTARVPPVVLGARVPARHVRGRQQPHDRGDRPQRARLAPSAGARHRPNRLDARLRRARQHDVPRLARSRDRTRATVTRATR